LYSSYITKLNILILCENKGNFNNIHPVLESLEVNLDINVIYFNLDIFFHQNTRDYFNNNQIITPPLVFDKPFYSKNKIARLNTLRLLKKNINLGIDIDLIIAGSFGAVEYTVANAIINNNTNCKLIFIQDSILLQTEKYYKRNIFNVFRNLYYANQHRLNICDIIFVSGSVTKNVLIADGVQEKKIEITGIPRFSYLMNNQSYQTNTKKVLILLGANKWHGYNKKLFQFECFVINEIKKLIIEHTITYNILFRPHPRGNINFPRSLDNYIEDASVIEINDSILESDIIVSIGYPSTSLFEAVLLKKNVYLIKDGHINYKVNQQDIFDETINVIELDDFIYKIKNDLIHRNRNEGYINSNIHHFISDKTPNSVRRITDAILLNKINTLKTANA